jgi:hypothetical protein
VIGSEVLVETGGLTGIRCATERPRRHMGSSSR